MRTSTATPLLAVLLASLALTGCRDEPSAPADPSIPETTSGGALTAADDEAIVRFLSHASFGASPATIAEVRRQGYGRWLKSQLELPFSDHLPYVRRVAPATNAQRPSGNPVPLVDSVMTKMVLAPDQVRQRLAFAYSEIFVVSTNDAMLARRPAGVARYYDLLGKNAVGSYRQMLESVTLSPMMGIYLSSIKNQKALVVDGVSQREPDENYAREVMQLFSVGLRELNIDGTAKARETYTTSDIVNLAKIFTGWSWACEGQGTSEQCFKGTAGTVENRDLVPMQIYPGRHSPDAVTFLGGDVPKLSTVWTPQKRLERALDIIADHPNVGPFIGKQLIQRLVTSNPRPAYVRSVAEAFNSGTFVYGGETPAITFGDGQKGNLSAVAAAVLLHEDAMAPNITEKLDEPVLRFTRWARAFEAARTEPSDDGNLHLADMGDRDELAQTPLGAPSVFNFFRPGYTPPGSKIAEARKVAPELQITDEVTVASYANFMQRVVEVGAPARDGARLRSDYTRQVRLADQPLELVNAVNLALTGMRLTGATRNAIRDAVAAIPIEGTVTQQESAKLKRVRTAVFLTILSPEFLVH